MAWSCARGSRNRSDPHREGSIGGIRRSELFGPVCYTRICTRSSPTAALDSSHSASSSPSRPSRTVHSVSAEAARPHRVTASQRDVSKEQPCRFA